MTDFVTPIRTEEKIQKVGLDHIYPLNGPTTGMRPFNEVMNPGDITNVIIVAGQSWESFSARFDGQNLIREELLASSNNNDPVNWSGIEGKIFAASALRGEPYFQEDSIAIHPQSGPPDDQTISSDAPESISIGGLVGGIGGVAIGYQSLVSDNADDGVAIGNRAKVTKPDAVALGNGVANHGAGEFTQPKPSGIGVIQGLCYSEFNLAAMTRAGQCGELTFNNQRITMTESFETGSSWLGRIELHGVPYKAVSTPHMLDFAANNGGTYFHDNSGSTQILDPSVMAEGPDLFGEYQFIIQRRANAACPKVIRGPSLIESSKIDAYDFLSFIEIKIPQALDDDSDNHSDEIILKVCQKRVPDYLTPNLNNHFYVWFAHLRLFQHNIRAY